MSDNFELTNLQKTIIKRALDNRFGAIKGTAGSGKSLIALKLATRLNSDKSIQLEDLALNCSNVCIVTYQISLTNYLKYKDEEKPILILTVYDFFKEFLHKNGFDLDFGNRKKMWIEERNIDLGISKYKLIEEIEYIFANNIESIDRYIKMRAHVYDQNLLHQLYTHALNYRTHMKISKLIDYNDVPNKVLEIVGKGNTKPQTLNLVIDEVQDLSPTAIKALISICKNNVYFIGDITQSLYQTNFDWNHSLPNNTTFFDLDTNLRNTRQIFDAANSILRYETYIDNVARNNYSKDNIETVKSGHRPQVFFCKDVYNETIQIEYKINEIRSENPTDSICIAYRRNDSKISLIKNSLLERGFDIVESKNSSYENNQSIIISSLHSLKGLEFDHVILIEMNEDAFFKFSEPNESLERRLMYVAMTRAKESLTLFTSDDMPVRFIAEISAEKIVPIALNIPGYETAYRNHVSKVDETKIKLIESFEKQVDVYTDIEFTLESAPGLSEGTLHSLSLELEKARKKVEEIQNRIRYFESVDNTIKLNIDLPLSNIKRDRRQKILMVGSSNIDIDTIRMLMVSLGLHDDSFDYIDYNDIKNFDIKRVMNSKEYSDLFVGSVPHNTKGKGNHPSLVAHLMKNKDRYPKLKIFMENNNSLVPFNKTNLKNAIMKSELYKKEGF